MNIDATMVEISKLDLKSNDILVFKVFGFATVKELEQLRESFAPVLNEAGMKAIFINEAVNLEIIRSSEDSMNSENPNGHGPHDI